MVLMCVGCVLASPRIAQVDPSDEPLPVVVLSHSTTASTVVQMRRHGEGGKRVTPRGEGVLLL
jgi:hypothetical protein